MDSQNIIKYSIKELIDIGKNTKFCPECKGPIFIDPKNRDFCSQECWEIYNISNPFHEFQ